MPRLLALSLVLALAATASANAAMGLGLEMFSMETWTIYVIVTVVFEAWFIGRRYGRSWPASLGISVLANVVTGFGCISICAVGLHQTFVGSRLNPNPFLNAVVLFTGFGMVSALFESAVWAMFRVDRAEHNTLLWRTILAHLIGVPLGLAILLIPPEPYRGVLGHVRYPYLVNRIKTGLNQMLAEDRPFPCVGSLTALLKQLPVGIGGKQPDEWAACFEVDRGRFSMGVDRRRPVAQLNPAICGYRVPKEGATTAKTGTLWIIRRRTDSSVSGLVLDRDSGQIRSAHDPIELGFAK